MSLSKMLIRYILACKNPFGCESNMQYSIGLPVQVRPFPEYPDLHWQLCDPLILWHSASALQLWVPVAHSSISKYANDKRAFDMAFYICFYNSASVI